MQLLSLCRLSKLLGPVVTLASACVLAQPVAPSPPNRPNPTIQSIMARIEPAMIERYIGKLVSFGTRHTLSDTTSATRGIGAARRWIKAELEQCAAQSNGRMAVAFDEHVRPASARIPQAVQVVNVVATLKGWAQPERVIVVSGHYDSRASDVMDATIDAPGANDDASGSAAVLAMACAFAPHSFPATLVFMNVAGEEQGLLGADHFAETARQQNRNIIAMVTNDIIGSPVGDQGQRDDQQVRLFADGFSPLLKLFLDAQKAPVNPDVAKASSVAAQATRQALEIIARSGGDDDTATSQLGRYLKDAAERHLPGFTVKLIARRDRFLRGGDHLPFLERGYAAVRFTEPFENFAHQHQNVRTEGGVQFGDLPQFVDPAYVARVARVNAAGLASLALAPAAPLEVGIEVTELTNDTRLRWKAPTVEKPGGYRIVWREPGAPTWQFGRDVGDVTAFTLKDVSKDNFVFAVAAVSATGEASLPVFAQPVR
ncbi:M28 family metallopeptidase [Rhodoferax sp.]|uniref:M28 family metallopeptidase n=1 Tax=Rhodoferax sp. TaxID=50421 RepID=UPI0027793189|nr:M28 family metallopeptidase [Rhodoferax sp.]